MFNQINNEVIEQTNQSDQLGGGGYILETNVYDFEITKAYGDYSANGALGLFLEFTSVNGGQNYRETLYVTNRNGEATFEDKRSGKQVPLPSIAIADAICQCAAGVSLNQLDMQPKVIDVYDSDAGKELPTEKQVAMDLLGKPITLAIQKSTVNKTVKNEATGKWEPINEAREENQIRHVFHTESGMTYAEAKEGKEEPEFQAKWKEKYEGVTNDRFKEVKGGGRPAPSRAARTGSGDKPATASPFARKK